MPKTEVKKFFENYLYLPLQFFFSRCMIKNQRGFMREKSILSNLFKILQDIQAAKIQMDQTKIKLCKNKFTASPRT